MNITKMEYAEMIANKINGEAKVITKPNNVELPAVIVNKGEINPIIYIDTFYNDELSIEEAAQKVREIAERITITFPVDLGKFEDMKDKIHARLYNARNKVIFDVYRSAEAEGFEDLIIVPYIDGIIKNGSARITKEVLSTWKISQDEVMKIAMENSRDNIYFIDMSTRLKELTGMDMDMDIPFEMYILSNKEGTYGAYSIIPYKETLKEKFPGGFTVIPSSLHEVLIIPNKDFEDTEINDLIHSVNSTEVKREEVLSNHCYIF